MARLSNKSGAFFFPNKRSIARSVRFEMAPAEVLHTPVVTVFGLLLIGLFVAWFVLHSTNELLQTTITALRIVIVPEIRKLRTRSREVVKLIQTAFSEDEESPP